jgi:hypothetical protein
MFSIVTALDRTLNAMGDGPTGFVLVVFPAPEAETAQQAPCTVLSNLEGGSLSIIDILGQVHKQLQSDIPVAGHA